MGQQFSSDDLRPALDLKSAFLALTGHEPFLWQQRLFEEWLARGETPDAVDAPTGLGKTMVMALWLVARAMGAALPRRLVYVVDRRAVVDQATEEAEKLARALSNVADARVAALRTRLGFLDDSVLPVSTPRGEFADNREWLKSPHLPAVVVGTVDMIGSRLLFEGDGVSRRMRPMHAGLIGVDAWIVLDEARLVPPFEALLRSVAVMRRPGVIPGLKTTCLSATGRRTPGRGFALAPDDIDGDESAKTRVTAKRSLILTEAPEADLASAMAAHAVGLAEQGYRRILVFANSRRTAQNVADLIARAAPDALKPQLLVGARRVRERELLTTTEVFQPFLGETSPDSRAAFLVATSAGEVGADLDADALVCDLAPWERMAQRLGRVNRRGLLPDAPVTVFDAIDDDAEDAVENSTEARKAARSADGSIASALRELFASDVWPRGSNGALDASPLALRRIEAAAACDPGLQKLLERASTPKPLRPALTPALLDAWSMTSLREHTGRPLVTPWLRGWVDREPQTRILWRRILPSVVPGDAIATRNRLQAFFDAAPPHLTETLRTCSYEVADVVNRRVAAIKERSARSRAAADPAPIDPTDMSVVGDAEVVAVILTPAGEVESFATLGLLARHPLRTFGISARTVVISAAIGGLDAGGLLDARAEKAPPVIDDGTSPWSPGIDEIGVRIRTCSRDSGSARNWRVAFRRPVASTDEDGEGDEIRVEVYRGRRAAAGDLAIARKAQTLADHTDMLVEETRAIATRLTLPASLADTIAIAARLHDAGKRRTVWQRAMNAPRDALFAKTSGGGNSQRLRIGDEVYRHEFGSLRDAETDAELGGLPPELRDLALHLIAAHHGYARPVIPAVDPDEPPARSAARAAEAARRYARLQRRWGWWGIAWLESVLRAADWAASARNDAMESEGA